MQFLNWFDENVQRFTKEINLSLDIRRSQISFHDRLTRAQSNKTAWENTIILVGIIALVVLVAEVI